MKKCGWVFWHNGKDNLTDFIMSFFPEEINVTKAKGMWIIYVEREKIWIPNQAIKRDFSNEEV